MVVVKEFSIIIKKKNLFYNDKVAFQVFLFFSATHHQLEPSHDLAAERLDAAVGSACQAKGGWNWRAGPEMAARG